MLRQRLTYGPLLILLLLTLAWLDEFLDSRAAPEWFPTSTLPPGLVVGSLLLVVAFMGARELARILRHKDVHIDTWFAAAVAIVGVLVVGFTPTQSQGPLGFAVGISVVALSFTMGLLYAVRSKQTDGAIMVGAGVLLIHVYMGLMLGFLLLIRREHAVWTLLWVVVCVKACDIGAFFTGTMIGKHKLIAWLSPKKTWEGLIGGLVTSAAVGALGFMILSRSGIEDLPVAWGAPLGALFGALGQAGDLAASLFKRDAGVKDAGTSMPGFGGMLDLIDSPVFVAPFAYWCLTLLN